MYYLVHCKKKKDKFIQGDTAWWYVTFCYAADWVPVYTMHLFTFLRFNPSNPTSAKFTPADLLQRKFPLNSVKLLKDGKLLHTHVKSSGRLRFHRFGDENFADFRLSHFFSIMSYIFVFRRQAHYAIAMLSITQLKIYTAVLPAKVKCRFGGSN